MSGLTGTATASTVRYVYVMDSAAASTINAVNSTDGGNNNVNWVFNPAGLLDHFAISTVNDQVEDKPFQITITAQDTTNATVTGFTGTVSLSDRTGTLTPLTSGNFIAGVYSLIGGGFEHSIAGDYSSILGGYADTISATAHYSYLFGINSNLTEDSTFMVDMPHIRFGDETNVYEFPPDDGTAGQFIATDGNGQLSWSSAGLSLPYSGTATTSGTAFSATNYGSGRGIYGRGGSYGVEGRAEKTEHQTQ